jgi:diguanylate cyclase (GGDEF)-like protein
MPSPLGPGMRIMRRLGITGKLVTVVLLLLVPLGVSLVSGWASTTAKIAVLDREKSGQETLLPLIQIMARLQELDGVDGENSDAVRDAVGRADAALGSVSDTQGADRVAAGWAELRGNILALVDAQDGQDPQRTEEQAVLLIERTRSLIGQIAEVSGLVLDQEFASYYLTTALALELPDVLATTSRCQTAATGPDMTAPESSQCQRLLTNDIAQLQDDLDSAEAHLPTAENQALWPAEESLAAAVGQFSAQLPDVSGTAARPVTTTSVSLAQALAEALDDRFTLYRYELVRQRWQPVLLTLVTLLGVIYLVLALLRSTAQDVRSVLGDITNVSTGSPEQFPPLTGRDEFAQMSQALVFAQDRLTGLLSALRLQTTQDELTSLGNRSLFADKIRKALTEQVGKFAVIVLDLHRFSDINDSFGHDIGDQVLQTVGLRLHRAVGRRNVVARLGADEFAVLVTEPRSQADTQQIITRMRAALEHPIDIDGRRMRVSGAFGAVIHHAEDSDLTEKSVDDAAADLLRRAMVALSSAKTQRQSGTAFFEPWMQERTREHTELATDLVSAYEAGQFSVLYQPIVSLGSDTLYGVEALLRWVHPDRGPISPEVFVPLAEASGLIVPLGRWVLREAMVQMAQWQREFPDARPLTLDVNLSPDQLADASLPGLLLSLLNETALEPGRLVLEITETALVRDIELARHRLGQLFTTGVRLALDDFGTGYSSLEYLRELPVSVLKVDKTFMTGIEVPDGVAARLLRSIIDLGSALDLEIIAEGIENPTQLAALRSFGCRLGQGYLWSRPRPAEAVTDLLREGGAIRQDRAAIPTQKTAASAPDRGRILRTAGTSGPESLAPGAEDRF